MFKYIYIYIPNDLIKKQLQLQDFHVREAQIICWDNVIHT